MALRDTLERIWWQPRRGVLAWLSIPFSLVYRLLHGCQQWPWRHGWRKAWRAPVPVLVVGNLVVGGAGKTPTVIALCQALERRGWRPGIISRGYGTRRPRPDRPMEVTADSDAGQVGDEPLLMARRTGRPVWVAAARVAAAQALCARHPEVNLLISDDGLQHTALQRDAQVLVFDDRGSGNGLLLPAGPLREPLPCKLPERTVVLYNAKAPSTSLPGACAQRRVAGIQPLRDWWSGARGAMQPLELWRGRRVLAAAGIGHPERFFSMLEQAGLLVDRLPLADHAPLDPRPWPAEATCVLVTEKDAVKLKLRPADRGEGAHGAEGADAQVIHVATLDFALPDNTVDGVEQLLLAARRP